MWDKTARILTNAERATQVVPSNGSDPYAFTNLRLRLKCRAFPRPAGLFEEAFRAYVACVPGWQ